MFWRTSCPACVCGGNLCVLQSSGTSARGAGGAIGGTDSFAAPVSELEGLHFVAQT